MRHEMSIVDGVLLWGNHLIIPMPMREEILSQIHNGHSGIIKCQQRAKKISVVATGWV